MYIAAGELHSLPRQKQKGKRLFLQFLIQDFERAYDLKKIIPLMNHTFIIKSHIDKEIHTSLFQYLMQLKKEFENRSFAYNIRMNALILNIIAEISRYIYSKAEGLDLKISQKIGHLSRINKFFQYIEENYQQNLSLDDAAKATGFSKYYLSRYLKNALGKSFIQFLHYYRIRKAEKLLFTGDNTVLEIANITGFGSASTSNRVFKEIKGCSPVEYKKYMV